MNNDNASSNDNDVLCRDSFSRVSEAYKRGRIKQQQI